ncbi:MAG TPA: peptidoglycan editing factor PgeF [Anaerolineae bacterium]|nr:peptidoglycan editing factor PgeF [Anaerolineae bacterium]
MIRHVVKGIPYYAFPSLEQHAEMLHAVFTRLGGVSRPPYRALNVGNSLGDDPKAVEENHGLVWHALAVQSAGVVTARQVHGNRVAIVGTKDGGSIVPQTDALITSEEGVTLMLRFGDCLPILLYDTRRRVVGLGHAGWRGTAATVASRMVSAMIDSFGSDPADVLAGLGPAIGPCCYEVGDEVVQAIKPTLHRWQEAIRPYRDGHFSLDLWEANRQQLRDRGVTQIETGNVCTACHAGEFFSHRADRGETGRFATLMGLRKSA